MSKANKSKKIILVVDDDPILQRLYSRMFNKYGIDVLIARDGEEGLEMITREEPDFVILDIRMPKLDGIEVLKRIRRNGELKNIPVLMLTNYDLIDYREQVKGLDVVDFFLVKTDIKPTELVKRVTDFLKTEGANW